MLSRLWWAGKLTYDEANQDNPYALTDVLTSESFASRILLFSSSNFLANKKLALGILDAIKAQADSGVKLKREHFVGATKYLNCMGAITVVDYLSRDQVRTLVLEYFASDEFAKLRV